MFNRFILLFFYFFLISRFFSEKIKILPKYIDIINYPLFVILFILLIFNINKKSFQSTKEISILSRLVFLFTITYIIAIIFNNNRIIFASTFLFYAGFMEGPFLLLALDKLSNNPLKLARQLNNFFFTILIINLFINFIIDIPEFLLTSNPDVISGTYGNNTYQYSMLLLICGGYLLGYNYIYSRKVYITIISQLVILLVFYLTQFRAGLPFFIISYLFMIGFLYGKKIIYKLIPIVFSAFLFIYVVLFLTQEEKAIEGLKFEDWIEIVSEPSKFMSFGKFKIYMNVVNLINDYPETLIIGTGPGNFLSRANYVFSYELLVRSKGVSKIVSDIFDINYPYFSDLHTYYVYNRIRPEIIYGTWQLSNPYTSYLSAITEIGIFGGLSIILIYFYMSILSIRYSRVLKKSISKYLPMSVAFIGSSTYLFQLAFLENYWEQARVTLPVWLLFWAVKTVANSGTEDAAPYGNTVETENQ